uniref:Uncharacterized protein n=1 Tax=Kocuria rosea subsp. polaris TaxID=136273 RepID=A0A0A6VPE9_KOCRO|nr:hypothetical protein GY22_16610 [Kocuria polaris]
MRQFRAALQPIQHARPTPKAQCLINCVHEHDDPRIGRRGSECRRWIKQGQKLKVLLKQQARFHGCTSYVEADETTF